MPAVDLQRPFAQVENTDVYVSYPQQKDAEKAGRAPRVILICGWMEATLPQLHKFTEMYHWIYPSAIQILIRTYRKSMFSELTTNKAYVQPAVKLLHDAGIKAYDPPESSGLLAHCISNGGALAQTYLAHCLADTHPAPPPKMSALPSQALIYDSVPSEYTLSTFLTFFSLGISSSILRTMAKSILVPAYGGMVIYKHSLDRRPDLFTTLRAEMSDVRLIPQIVPQIYIYGDEDLVTPEASIKSHIAAKKQMLKAEGGYADGMIMAERYEGSSHVSHAKRDPKRYWDAVVRVWDMSYPARKASECLKLRAKL